MPIQGSIDPNCCSSGKQYPTTEHPSPSIYEEKKKKEGTVISSTYEGNHHRSTSSENISTDPATDKDRAAGTGGNCAHSAQHGRINTCPKQIPKRDRETGETNTRPKRDPEEREIGRYFFRDRIDRREKERSGERRALERETRTKRATQTKRATHEGKPGPSRSHT